MPRTGTVALWEPDITPPDEWLLPSILYQERISTLAPSPDVDDSDGREAQRLGNLLGSLYEPLSLMRAMRPESDDQLVRHLVARLPFWRVQGETNYKRTSDPRMKAWLDRSANWESRRQSLESRVDELRAAQARERQKLGPLESRFQTCQQEVNSLSAEIEDLRHRLEPERVAEKWRRRQFYSETIARRDALIADRARWGRDPTKDAAIRGLDEELKEIRSSIPPAVRSADWLEYQQRISLHDEALATRDDAWRKLRAQRERVSRSTGDVERAERIRYNPWVSDTPVDYWIHDGTNSSSNFDSLAAGKVQTAIFRFLATRAGLWVRQRDGVPYAGTLVGPSWVISEVLSIVAEWHCAGTQGWVPMSRLSPGPESRSWRQEPRDAEELLTLGITWLLPAPRRGSLTEAVKFRESHHDELLQIREALATAFPDVTKLDDLRDGIRVVAISIAEPIAEIERALELSSRLGVRTVRSTVGHMATSGLRNFTAGLAAAAVATPLLGNTIGLVDTEAAVGGGITLATASYSAKLAYDYWARRQALEHVTQGPYRYLYDVGRTFGIRDGH